MRRAAAILTRKARMNETYTVYVYGKWIAFICVYYQLNGAEQGCGCRCVPWISGLGCFFLVWAEAWRAKRPVMIRRQRGPELQTPLSQARLLWTVTVSSRALSCPQGLRPSPTPPRARVCVCVWVGGGGDRVTQDRVNTPGGHQTPRRASGRGPICAIHKNIATENIRKIVQN